MTTERQRARMLEASIADLHEQLGWKVAGPLGRVPRPDGGKPWDASKEMLRDMAVEQSVNWDCLARLRNMSRQHLASLSPERRAQLEAEWQ